MNITKLTVLDFSINERGRVVKVEVVPLIGESREPITAELRIGDTVTVDAPVADSPRYWGIYHPESKGWLKKASGELFYYPAEGIALAHLKDHQAAMAHTVDGRGKSLTESLVVREMTATTDGP